MENIDKIWILMARSLSGEITDAEQEELAQVLLQNPDLNQQLLMLRRFWDKDLTSDGLSPEKAREKFLFNNILAKAAEKREQKVSERPKSFIKRLFSKRLMYAYAASIALVAFFAVVLSRSKSESLTTHLIAAQNGSKTKVLLSDGTTVWLNSGSKLYYDFDFSDSTREVRLEGEAFFDVVKEAARPFIVHAGKIDIKVHGTAFNVKYYTGDKNIETTLLHGKVEVKNRLDKVNKSVFMVPNQKLIVPVVTPRQEINARPMKIYELIDLDESVDEQDRIETAWIYNRIEFRGENFDDLAKMLERWYNVNIEFENEEVRRLTFNGSFEKETVEQAFAALKKVGNFNYKIQGREISIQ